MWRQRAKQRLEAEDEEMSEFLDKTGADCEQERPRFKDKMQQNKILDAVFNPRVSLHRLVFPADVQQKVLIKEEAPEEWRPGVDQKDPETLNIKEELWTSLEEEQLSVKETDDPQFPFTAVPLKSEDDEENLLFSQLHQHQVEEPTRNPDLTTDEDDSSSVETEVSEADEDDEDVLDPDSELKDFSDSGSEPEDSDKDWKESRAPESGVNTVNKPFSCSECGKQFVHKLSFQRHMTCHSRKMSSANLVHKKCFRVKKTGGSSKKIQSEQKSFSCVECGHRFGQKSNLNRHMIVHSGQKPFACDVCGQRFGQKYTLNTHMIVHTGQKPFACDICGQRFGLKSHLNTHMIVHTGQKPFACDLCGQRFGHKSTLNTHMRVHTGQKPFACDVCGQRFGQKSSLNTHMRVHTGQKPFACDLCGQRFGQKSSLNTHMRVHTGQKPFACDVCGQRFGQKSSLNTHMIVHTGQKQFACDVCGQRFGHKSTLNSHMKVHPRRENRPSINIKTAPKDT